MTLSAAHLARTEGLLARPPIVQRLDWFEPGSVKASAEMTQDNISEGSDMTHFPVHTMDSAPEGSKPALQQLQSAFGMIPNMAGAIATSPVLINSLVGLFGNALLSYLTPQYPPSLPLNRQSFFQTPVWIATSRSGPAIEYRIRRNDR
jgi:hypothetical protein